MSEHEQGGDAYESKNIHDHEAADVCRPKCPAYGELQREKAAAMRAAPRQATGAQMQNARGEWVPAIPEPYFLAFGRDKCECGAKFRNRRRYREHYALDHILDPTTTATESEPR